jgi:hypothetical protein
MHQFLMLAAMSAPSGSSFEHKFLFPRESHDFILQYLKHATRPDPEFPAGQITSIYYDTPTLDCYYEKRDSTYLKSKVRVRWYGSPKPPGDVSCFLELKAKTGATRQKHRVEMKVPARVLAGYDLHDPSLAIVPSMLESMGLSFPGAFVPMLVVQYDRTRFVDPATNARLAVDINIRCPKVNQRFVPGIGPVFLDMGVFEVKGPERDLPPSLLPLGRCLTSGTFSKYATCFEQLLEPASRRL